MQYLKSVTAAARGKAPIVAIPVEGHAPACVDRKRLAGWLKKVQLSNIEIEQRPNVTSYTFERPRGKKWNGVYEGPERRVEHVTPGARTLILQGNAGRVRCSARFVIIDRRTATKELSKWTERERAKQHKKIMLGALSKQQKREIKLAAHNDTGALVPVDVHLLDGKVNKRLRTYGAAVEIAELAEYQFVVHRCIDYSGEVMDRQWSVTETTSGMSAGKGTTAEEAIAAARSNTKTASPERLATVRANIAKYSAAALAA